MREPDHKTFVMIGILVGCVAAVIIISIIISMLLLHLPDMH